MARIILLQLAVAVVVASIYTLVSGFPAGVSSILAGLACVIPNAIFAFGIEFSDRKARKPGLFYLWELVKVFLTIILMVAVFWFYRDVDWAAFFVSLIIVLKSYVFFLFKKSTN